MKNPLKPNHTGLYIGIGAVAAVAGAAAYLYLTDNGADIRSDMREKAKDLVRDIASAFISEQTGIHKYTVRKAAEHVG